MICQRCGAEIDTRYTFPDGSVQCPGCGLMYRPTYAPQQPQQTQQQAPQMQQFQQPEQPAAPRRRRSAQYAENPPEPPRNNPPPIYPTRNDDEPPKKKSSKKWLIIVAAVLCVLVLAFVGIRIFSGSKKSSGKQIASADMSGVKIEQISVSDIAVDEDTKVKYVKGELVFVAKDGVTFEQVDDYFRDGGFYENGTELVSYDTTLGIYIVKHSYGASYFELGNEAEITLNYTDLFEDIFPNYVVDIANNAVNDSEWQPWDSRKEQHWGWDAIYMNEAQARLDGMQLTDVDVGVIDNQFYGHDDIGVWSTSYGVDYDSSIKSPEHGTHVSGIIGAANNNGVGIAGVTDKIRLHCFSTYGFSVSGEAEGGSMAITTWLTAIGQLVERNNCKVINISQGFAWKDRKDVKNDDGSQPSQEEYEQIQRQGMDEYLPHVEKILRKILKKHDFLLVVSAGNSNNDDQQSGKAELNSIFNYIKAEDITPHILVVGSASKTKGGSIYISDYSSYGDRVDVTAPGDNIYSTVPKKDGFMSFLTGSDIYNSGYEYMSGTSMSAPYITGIAALVWNINPNFTSAQVRQFIERGCEATYGYREGQWFSRNETHLFVDAEHVVSNALLEMSISANPPTEPSAPETPTNSSTNSASGILVLTYQEGEDVYYPNNNLKCESNKVDVYVANPDNGEVYHYKTFSTIKTKSSKIAFYPGYESFGAKNMFTDDMTKVAAYILTEDGNNHIGWVDEYGQFTDVTKKLYPNGNEPTQSGPWFYQGYLYFIETEPGRTVEGAEESGVPHYTKRVPINTLEINSVETVSDQIYDSFLSNVILNGINIYIFGDRISDSEFIGIGGDGIYKYSQTNPLSYNQDKLIVPLENDKFLWSPVVSPDKKRIAFLSCSTSSGEYTEGALRITSIDGGETEKVDVPVKITRENALLIGWKDNISGVTEYKQDDANTTEMNNPATINTGNAEEHVETFTWTDSKGYTFEAQLHISPWFLQSDKSAIGEFLSKNKYNISAPTLDSWEIKSTGSSQFRKENGVFQFLVPEVNDMYYSFGWVTIKNVTDGWNLSADNKAYPTICLRFIDENSGKTDGAYGNNSHYTAIATRVFYDNRAIDTDGFLAIEPTMISNNWGPVEFVIAHAESITPKNPTGIYGDRVKATSCEVYLGNVLFPDNKLDSVSPFKIEYVLRD